MGNKSEKLSIEDLRELLVPIARRYNVDRVVLFGSSARGDAAADSDYDFCIDPGSVKSAVTFGHLYMDIRHAIGKEVDVISRNALEKGSEFLLNVERDGVVIYER
ncbi:MAG: nucleotidyltransferase domain-containing protein [Candidatus Methanoplasma sp.]|jgi:predicted nucleotidyltransferase|nr:nucleotidyltransferase domain-containing protein [Candidatus Methanoplasma sp.]